MNAVMDDTLTAKGRDQDHGFFPLTIRRNTWEPKGALVCIMLCFTASPPLTVVSVTMYLSPASISNRTPPKPPQRPIEAPRLSCHAQGRSWRPPAPPHP
jgi:hypothetical protein